MNVHPAAKVLPAMSEADLAELVEDIRKHGQRSPVVFYRGQVLDGRHRIKACEALEIAVRSIELPEDENPWAYVASVNLARRHLPVGQKAALFVQLAEGSEEWAKAEEEAEARKRANLTNKTKGEQNHDGAEKAPSRAGRTSEKKAKAAGVSATTVKRAEKVKRRDPEAFDKVAAGELSLTKAEEQIRKPAVDDLPDVDKAGDEIPLALRDTWGAMASASRRTVKALEAVDVALAAALKEIAPRDALAIANGADARAVRPLQEAFGMRLVERGTAAEPDERLSSEPLESLKRRARAAAPWIVCPSCRGTTKCPGADCLDRVLSSKCQCRAACWFCEGLGLLTSARHSSVKNSHPALRKAR